MQQNCANAQEQIYNCRDTCRQSQLTARNASGIARTMERGAGDPVHLAFIEAS
jgi:hypothetical protein